VSIFISRAMTVCSSACSSSSLGAPARAFGKRGGWRDGMRVVPQQT
jgi:hypothetical protein